MIATSGIINTLEPISERSVIFADDYLNKLSGEQIEYDCKRHLETGCKEIEVNFSKTEIINSIGISILLGVIDTASNTGARVVFTDVNENTVELFEMLGLTKHVVIETNKTGPTQYDGTLP